MPKILLTIFLIIALTAGAGATVPMPADVAEAVAAAKKSPKNQKLNRKAAEALRDAGFNSEAIGYFLKSDNRGNLDAAELCFEMYDFDRAADLLEKYTSKRSREHRNIDEQYYPDWSDAPADYTDVLGYRINLGRSMLDRVEKIQVIDSVNVPADDFVKVYRLARASGALRSEQRVEKVVPRQWFAVNGLSTIAPAAYESEAGDYMIFSAASDDAGDDKMYETYKLADGKWIEPVKLFDYQSIFGKDTGNSVDFPFLMPDGVTLYFAADGEESLGGLDIFVSRRDDDGFLQPSNVGMPYNSPANDYMLAIDEVNNIGWWVSDRTGLTDSVTVYTFIPGGDMRVNYPADTPGLADIASLKSISLTIPEGVAIAPISNRLNSVDAATADEDSFALSMPDGRVLTSYSEFRSPAARKAMEQYIKATHLYEANCRQLAQLREKYASGDHSVSFRILSLEEEVEKQRDGLVPLRNEVVKAEMSR